MFGNMDYAHKDLPGMSYLRMMLINQIQADDFQELRLILGKQCLGKMPGAIQAIGWVNSLPEIPAFQVSK